MVREYTSVVVSSELGETGLDVMWEGKIGSSEVYSESSEFPLREEMNHPT